MDTRNATPLPVTSAPAQPALHTPLVWAWGGALLTVTLWLTGIIALVRSFGSLFG
jgi:hypothetical protein